MSKSLSDISYNIYYINLTEAEDRRINIEKQFKTAKRIIAICGAKLTNRYSYKHVNLNAISKVNISYPELGATLSHLKAIITAYLNGDSEALILEDDVNLNFYNKCPLDINTIISRKPADAECILLHCINAKEITKMLNTNEEFSPWNLERWSMAAYYINRKGMEKIYNKFFKNNYYYLPDCTSNQKLKNVADNIIPYTLNTYNYTRPLFCHECKNSYIHNNHLPVHIKALGEIERYFTSMCILNVIIPVQDHNFELGQILKDLSKIFIEQRIIPKYYIMYQNNDEKFNKGLNNNYGFLYASQNNFSKYYLFIDVDVYPVHGNIINYKLYLNDHMMYNKIYHPYRFKHAISDFFILNKTTFININGFSNKYNSLGYESIDFTHRAALKDIDIDIVEFIDGETHFLNPDTKMENKIIKTSEITKIIYDTKWNNNKSEKILNQEVNTDGISSLTLPKFLSEKRSKIFNFDILKIYIR